MHQIIRSLTTAFVAAAFVQLSCPIQAQPVAEPPPKQIALTEKQVLAFIAAQKDIQPIWTRYRGRQRLPPPIKTELEAAAKKNGFKDFNDYDEVTTNITMVMTESHRNVFPHHSRSAILACCCQNSPVFEVRKPSFSRQQRISSPVDAIDKRAEYAVPPAAIRLNPRFLVVAATNFGQFCSHGTGRELAPR